jgi:hypothetical protein
MQKPPLDPDVADTAPIDSMLTPYDHEHLITYRIGKHLEMIGVATWYLVST